MSFFEECVYLFPVQSALFPFVDKANDKDGQKDENSDETGHAYVLQRNGPRQQESDFQVKQDEENGDQIEANVELHSSVFESFKATFVRGILGSVWAIGTQDIAKYEGNYSHSDAHQDEKQDREILLEVHVRSRLPLVDLAPTTA
ncbi:hypothetical protein BMF29_10625 [Comamonas kerstersii]|uniref:Uncharacterized protein n=1 Tax=Comamonas kerstersii TaxID=225992 RepID=A0A0W7YXF3_9BURK|nr:hypothetical protein AS359_13595 [Comamonas kerstersii]OOH88334.1 hypothetical protein BMF38_02655 [Comamonas kerstersii]OOH91703.1 hypothetical protein BMF29_10625 [Comamonas kerstersii]